MSPLGRVGMEKIIWFALISRGQEPLQKFIRIPQREELLARGL